MSTERFSFPGERGFEVLVREQLEDLDQAAPEDLEGSVASEEEKFIDISKRGMEDYHQDAPEWLLYGLGLREVFKLDDGSIDGTSWEGEVKKSYQLSEYRLDANEWEEAVNLFRNWRQLNDIDKNRAIGFRDRVFRYMAFSGEISGGLATMRKEHGEALVGLSGVRKAEMLKLIEPLFGKESELEAYRFLKSLHEYYETGYKARLFFEEPEGVEEKRLAAGAPSLDQSVAENMEKLLLAKQCAIEGGYDEHGQMKVYRPLEHWMYDPLVFFLRKDAQGRPLDGYEDLPYETRLTIAMVREIWDYRYVQTGGNYEMVVMDADNVGKGKRIRVQRDRVEPAGHDLLDGVLKKIQPVLNLAYDSNDYRLEARRLETVLEEYPPRASSDKLGGVGGHWPMGVTMRMQYNSARLAAETQTEHLVRLRREQRTWLYKYGAQTPYTVHKNFTWARRVGETVEGRVIDPKTGFVLNALAEKEEPAIKMTFYIDYDDDKTLGGWKEWMYRWVPTETFSAHELRRRGLSEEYIDLFTNVLKIESRDMMRRRMVEAYSHYGLLGKGRQLEDMSILLGRDKASINHAIALQLGGAFPYTTRMMLDAFGAPCEGYSTLYALSSAAKIRVWFGFENQEQLARKIREGSLSFQDHNDDQIYELLTAGATYMEDDINPLVRLPDGGVELVDLQDLLTRWRRNRAIGSPFPYILPYAEGTDILVEEVDHQRRRVKEEEVIIRLEVEGRLIGQRMTVGMRELLKDKKVQVVLRGVDEVERRRGRELLGKLEERVDKGEDPRNWPGGWKMIYFAGVVTLRRMNQQGRLREYLAFEEEQEVAVRSIERSMRMLGFAGNDDYPADVPYYRVSDDYRPGGEYWEAVQYVADLFKVSPSGGSGGDTVTFMNEYGEPFKQRMNFALTPLELFNGLYQDAVWTKYKAYGVIDSKTKRVKSYPLRNFGSLAVGQLWLNAMVGSFEPGSGGYADTPSYKLTNAQVKQLRKDGIEPWERGEPELKFRMGDEAKYDRDYGVTFFKPRFRDKNLYDAGRGEDVDTVCGGPLIIEHAVGDKGLGEAVLNPGHDLPLIHAPRDWFGVLMINYLLKYDPIYKLAINKSKLPEDALVDTLDEYELAVSPSPALWDRSFLGVIPVSRPRYGYMATLKSFLEKTYLQIRPEVEQPILWAMGANYERALRRRAIKRLGFGMEDLVQPLSYEEAQEIGAAFVPPAFSGGLIGSALKRVGSVANVVDVVGTVGMGGGLWLIGAAGIDAVVGAGFSLPFIHLLLNKRVLRVWATRWGLFESSANGARLAQQDMERIAWPGFLGRPGSKR